MTPENVAIARAAALVLAGSLFWLQYWDLKDRKRPEPRGALFVAFVLGGLSAVIALGLYTVAAALGVPMHATTGTARVLIVCLVFVGPIEEASKFLVARASVFRWRAFDEHVDGVVYGAAVSLGFAAAENAFWLPEMGARDGVVRALCSPLVHTLFGAIWGYGTARALLDARGRAARFGWQAGSLALAAAAHGVYDALLYSGASAPVIAGAVLVLWIAVIVVARRAAKRDDAAAAAEPQAPAAGSQAALDTRDRQV